MTTLGSRCLPASETREADRVGKMKVRNVAREAGIERRVWLHLIRHSAITQMLRRQVSPIMVAQIVGHSSLEMINRVYAHLSKDDAYEAMVAYLAEP